MTRRALLILAAGAFCLSGCRDEPAGGPDGGDRPPGPLRIFVVDPFAEPRSCVTDYAPRRYDLLAEHLGRELGRKAELLPGGYLPDVLRLNPGEVDLIVGKKSLIEADLAGSGQAYRPAAVLSDAEGLTTLVGLFVVPAESALKTLGDLAGKKVLFGPKQDAERHDAALAALNEAVPNAEMGPEVPRDVTAVLNVIDGKADAAVVSEHDLRFGVACGALSAGEVRPVGRSKPVPFITVFLSERLSPQDATAVSGALERVAKTPELLEKLNSRDGFLPVD